MLSDENENLEQERSLSVEEGSQDIQLVSIIDTYDDEMHYETILEHIEFDWEVEEINPEPDHDNKNEIVQAVMKNKSSMLRVRWETIQLIVMLI